MTNYTRGRAKEYECIDTLKLQGYQTHRTAGSHSEVDVFAFLSQGAYDAFVITGMAEERPQIRWIQCKLGNSSIKKAVIELKKMANQFPFASVELWQYTPRVKEPKITIFKNKNI